MGGRLSRSKRPQVGPVSTRRGSVRHAAAVATGAEDDARCTVLLYPGDGGGYGIQLLESPECRFIRVSGLVPGGPAALSNGGLQVGDRMVGANGTWLADFPLNVVEELIKAATEELTLIVERDSSKLDLPEAQPAPTGLAELPVSSSRKNILPPPPADPAPPPPSGAERLPPQGRLPRLSGLAASAMSD